MNQWTNKQTVIKSDQLCKFVFFKVRLMVFDATFNTISVILWLWSVLLVEKTGVPGENH